VSIDQLRQNYPIDIRWVQYPLHPDTPEEGLSLEALFPGRDLNPMRERMRGLMAEAGLPYGNRSHTYNSRRAQELGKWADSQAGGEALHRALFKAYFVDGINIALPEVLLDIVSAAGLDRQQAAQVLAEGSFAEAVDADWALARASGITGVPTFVHGDLMVVGCQPYEILERFVQHLLQQQS
jgi:predicted DsbA family dithiol-disulfide isomerase